MTRLKPFLSAEELGETVSALAESIRRDYAGKRPLLIGVLQGSFIFLADLARALEIPLDVAFLSASSYETGTTPSPEVKLEAASLPDVKGRELLIVEDIVDSGKTLTRIMEHLRELSPASIKVCTLLRREGSPVGADYVGSSIEKGFVVGYGLDYRGEYRYLPALHIMEED